MEKKESKGKSFHGRGLIKLNIFCHNLSTFMGNNPNAIVVFFLSIYVLIQIAMIVVSGNNPSIGILVVILLSVLALEKISLNAYYKGKEKQLEKEEEELTTMFNEYQSYAENKIARLLGILKKRKKS